MADSPSIIPWIVLVLAAGFVFWRHVRRKAVKRRAGGDGGDSGYADFGNDHGGHSGGHSSGHSGGQGHDGGHAGDAGGDGGGDGGGGNGGGGD
jgi:hypothetical protein